MNNLHISLTEFRNESRVIKETNTLIKSGIFKNVYILSLGSSDLLESETLKNGVIVRRLILKSRFLPKNLFFQLFKYLEFFLYALNFIRIKKIKVLNIHSIALLPLGWISKVFNKHKLIYDAHELETEVHNAKGLRKHILKFIEKKLIYKCDLVIVVSENIADWYKNTYKITRPTVVMNAPALKNIASQNIFREIFGIKDSQLIFLYQGGLGAGRGIELLLKAFQKRQNNKAVIVFMGYGNLKDKILREIENCNNIFYLPAVSVTKVLDYTSSADIGFAITENTCLSHNFSMPNKLFEYTMVGLPVVVSNLKEMSNFVRKNNCGFVLNDNNVEELNKVIDLVLTTDLSTIKQNAIKASKANSWEVQERKMLKAYKSILFQESLG